MPDDGHGWNKELEHDYYVDNVAKHGVVAAREMSRRNIRSYRAELAGLQTDFSWRINDTGTDAISEDGFSLMEMVKNPLEGLHADKASANHREAAKLIIPTSEQALALAAAGEKLIIFPEHDVNRDGVVARFITIWEQDNADKKLYHGRRIDLGVGIKIDNIREKTKNLVLGDQPVQYHEDSEKKDAFVFSVSKATIQTKDVSKPLYDSIHFVNDSPHPAISIVDLPRIITNGKSAIKEEKESIIVDSQDSQRELYLLLTDPSREESLTRLTQIPIELKDLEMSSEALSELWKIIAQEELRISVEQSEKLLETVQRTWTNMEQRKDEIVFAGETKVAVGGALLLLDQMVQGEIDEVGKTPDPIEEAWVMMKNANEIISFTAETGIGYGAFYYAMQESVAVQIDKAFIAEEFFETYLEMQNTKEDMFLAPKESVFIPVAVFALGELASMPPLVDILDVVPVVLTEEDKKEFSVGILPDVVDRVVFEETKEFIKKIETLAPQEQKEEVAKEKERVEERIVLVWEAVVTIKPEATIHSPGDIIDLEPEEKNIEQFSFAFAVWTILKLIHYRSALIAIESGEKNLELLVQKETGQSLLIAIIWFIEAIKEQDALTIVPPVKKKKPKEVIIYAYAS